jgi:hypothetical protein
MSEIKMRPRDLHQEAWVWYHLTSVEFAQAARQAMKEFVEYYIDVADLGDAWGTGRTDQIAQVAATYVREYDHAIELMKQGDYRPIWKVGCYIGTDWSQISKSVLPLVWIPQGEERGKFERFFGRADFFAGEIRRVFINAFAMAGLDPNNAELYNRDDSYICEEIMDQLGYAEEEGYPIQMPVPTPQYEIDTSVSCKSGETVPWTGVWYPETGLDRYSLAFAIKGQPMQPAYHLESFNEELYADAGVIVEETTRAVPTTWHPVMPKQAAATAGEAEGRLRALPGDEVPRSGFWWSLAVDGGRPKQFTQGERFPETVGTDEGAVIWYYDPNRQTADS